MSELTLNEFIEHLENKVQEQRNSDALDFISVDTETALKVAKQYRESKEAAIKEVWGE